MYTLQLHNSNHLTIYSAQTETAMPLPFVIEGISAGFPSPAMDFVDLTIDLNRHLIKHPASTFYGLAKGDCMKNAGIFDEDLLVIDKSLEPINNKIAVCYIDGEFTLLTDDWVKKYLAIFGLRLKKDLEGIPTLDFEKIQAKKILPPPLLLKKTTPSSPN